MDAKEIKITNQIKVKNILNQLVLNKAPAIVWQNDGQHYDRITMKATTVKLSPDLSQIYLTPVRDKFKFYQYDPIYFLNETKSILFKTNIYHHSAYKLKLETPKIIIIRDARKDTRQALDHKNITISYGFGSKKMGGVQNLPYTSKLLDFSYGGLSFHSSLPSVKMLTRGDLITIRFPDQKKQIMEAKVCYVTRFLQEQSHKSSYRVGVNFC